MVFAIKTSSWPLNGASRETGCKGLSQGAQKAESCERKPANDAHWRDMDKNRVSGLKRQHRCTSLVRSALVARGETRVRARRVGYVCCYGLRNVCKTTRLAPKITFREFQRRLTTDWRYMYIKLAAVNGE